MIPLLVRPVDWKDAPFAHLQALPTDARPLSTWQDEDTALADVVAGIRRVLEDLPLLTASAPRAALPAIWNIPYPRNPFFLGRESELAQCATICKRSGDRPLTTTGHQRIGRHRQDPACSGICLSVSPGLPGGPVGTR